MQITSGLAHMNHKPAGFAGAGNSGRLAMCDSHLACMQGCICQSIPGKSGTQGAFRLEQPQHSIWSSSGCKHPQAFQACDSIPKKPADGFKAGQASRTTAYILHVLSGFYITGHLQCHTTSSPAPHTSALPHVWCLTSLASQVFAGYMQPHCTQG